jgi:hypothetical protein
MKLPRFLRSTVMRWRRLLFLGITVSRDLVGALIAGRLR